MNAYWIHTEPVPWWQQDITLTNPHLLSIVLPDATHFVQVSVR